jgi:hypothetical protein
MMDAEWADYVRGRSVAIVGPAVPLRDQSEEIDGHDIVIRCGWVGPASLHPWYGSVCQVTFFNKANSSHWSASGTADADLRTLDWVLTKVGTEQPFVGRSRQVHLPAGLNANQVPILLHDLSLFAPGPVSVFGADFYWNPQASYTSEYLSFAEQAQPTMQGTSMAERMNGHHWDRQRQSCRQSMRTLDVVGDDRFLDVLALDDDVYRNGMLARYEGLTW